MHGTDREGTTGPRNQPGRRSVTDSAPAMRYPICVAAPTSTLIWTDAHLAAFFAPHRSTDGRAAGLIDVGTQISGGDRALLYRAGNDAALVGYADIAGRPAQIGHRRWITWCTAQLLPTPIDRDVLVNVAGHVFTRPHHQGHFGADCGTELTHLIGLDPAPLCTANLGFDHDMVTRSRWLRWVGTSIDDTWDTPGDAHTAIYDDPSSRRLIGGATQATPAALCCVHDIDSHTVTATTERAETDTTTHLVATRAITTAAISAARRHPNLRIWAGTRHQRRVRLTRLG